MQDFAVPQHPYHVQVNESVPLNTNVEITKDTPLVTQNNQKSLLGPDSTVTECQFCNCTVRTAIRYTSTTRTIASSARCFFMCCCCCLPFCMSMAKNTDHYCPQCHRYLGTYVK